MIRLVKAHPLVTVMIIALLMRLIAVMFSQGFIHSDDHYDSVDVAYYWLQNGFWGENGQLCWKEYPASTIGRFPLYTMFLYGIMKLYASLGITALDKMMYGVRLTHALLSLLPVWVIFRIMSKQTDSIKWAIAGGLMVALHFGMPFLGVRNSIEVVGGNLWIVAIYFFYRYQNERQTSYLYWAGVLTGLAWMIRFQLAFAVLPIPLILWYEYRSLKPALHYSAAVAVMLLISGIVDYALVGRFASSTINNLVINTGLGARYATVPFVYLLVILAFFIPPFSLVMAYLAALPGFWRKHRLLVISTLSFILCHILHRNQQERFMMPVVPVLFLIAALAMWHRYKEKGCILKNRKLLTVLAAITLIINFTLIIPFTTAYGHMGLVEPMIQIERLAKKPRIMIVQPHLRRWIPINYAGFDPPQRVYVREWSEFDRMRPVFHMKDSVDLFILYPQRPGHLNIYRDSLEIRYGPLKEIGIGQESLYDRIMHSLNPTHYQRHEPHFYKRSSN